MATTLRKSLLRSFYQSMIIIHDIDTKVGVSSVGAPGLAQFTLIKEIKDWEGGINFTSES